MVDAAVFTISRGGSRRIPHSYAPEEQNSSHGRPFFLPPPPESHKKSSMHCYTIMDNIKDASPR